MALCYLQGQKKIGVNESDEPPSGMVCKQGIVSKLGVVSKQ
jgi:hypothetical protein